MVKISAVNTGRHAAEWAQWMTAGGMSRRTIDDRVALVNRFECAAGDSLEVDWRAISSFLSHPCFSAGTRQTYYAHLRAWFRWLVLTDRRLDDPTMKLSTPRGPRRKPRPLTLAQLERVLATRHHHRTRAMLLLAAYEGLRVSEVAKVRGEDLDDELLHVIGKGGVDAYIPIHPLVAEIATTMPTHGWWFPSHTRPPGPITSKAVSAILSDLLARAGVNATPHALRHFFGTETLRSSGGNLVVVKELMRHANVATTALYTEVDDNARRAAVFAMVTPRAA